MNRYQLVQTFKPITLKNKKCLTIKGNPSLPLKERQKSLYSFYIQKSLPLLIFFLQRN